MNKNSELKFSFRKKNNQDSDNKMHKLSLEKDSTNVPKIKENEIQSKIKDVNSKTNDIDKTLGQDLKAKIGAQKENDLDPIQLLNMEGKENKNNDVDNGEEIDKCIGCNDILTEEHKKPHWKWNLNNNGNFCLKCYDIKEKEYEKLINFCAVCDSKLKFLRYNPKPEWKIKGQLCRKCWDTQNTKFKSQNQR